MRRTFPETAWAVGEEGSDPVVLRDGLPFRHDQLAASGHYDAMDADTAAVAGLGVAIYRYGMPWRLAEPEPGRYEWSLWDRALAACERAGVEPIVDLCHFGLPDHYPGFCDPTWVDGFVRYVDAFLARYPSPRWFTPVNEPAITALASALLGVWNDRRTTRRDFGVALAHLVRANLEAVERIRADRDGAWIGSEGFEVLVPATPAAEEQVARRREEAWLVWDLHFGLEPRPAARDLLVGVTDAARDRIAALVPTGEVVAGHDVYPISIRLVGSDRVLTIDERLDAYVEEARRWHERYRRPFWVAETSNLGLPVDDQVAWLDGFAARLAALRAESRPVRGLCWYSRGDQRDWQTMLVEPTGAVTEVGLFDARRAPRRVAAAFARHARGEGDERVR